MSPSRRSFILAVVLAIACGDSAPETSPNHDAGAESDVPLHEVPCIDQSFSTLSLFEEVSPNGVLSEESDGGVFETVIDASAGGLQPTQSFVYARFTEQGLSKVELSDEDAFTSGLWHIAMRRFIIRLNSGVSGPSSVTAARTKPDTQFDTLASAGDVQDIPYRTEQYFTDTCEFVPDSSQMLSAPGTALASYWQYQQCVQMTGNVFVLALPGGRHVKLQVVAFYTLENQHVCDETGTVPMPSGAGTLRLRWAFLD